MEGESPPNPSNLEGEMTKRKKDGIDSRILFCQEKIDIAYRCSYSGLSVAEASVQLEISTHTYRRWIKKHPEFKKSIELGREDRVKEKLPIIEDSLFKSAIGYKIEEKNTKYIIEIDENGNEKLVKEKVEIKKREVAPVVIAQIFALKNLKPDTYSDTVKIEGKLSLVELMNKKTKVDENKSDENKDKEDSE